ncbi:CaiB/BaiF CoA transferase family protein [Paraburkholderia aspalathi]|jgi:crotonobetainyl-CoA:carnitine CoA-transferase CaiB-like acyl-CoA transferase|uniref:Crotonobetainyl-CoA:carnitine CoA-transferase CaiB n=1 Tax=Paraburkholderia aspalathi TaxID=1324617 RepID=A0A1I7DBS7_9BURK|nr:CoA transferase [Paraburkholderia aspalathi]SFU09183.1 Crotonobetainyl-CoA:carnitine CoA-transferase CaiB [Paraburkholderia aspalathi]
MTQQCNASHGDQPAGPLAGIKVVEIASIVLGPLAAQYLGDMGADVIKIEPPEGDLTRSLGPQRNKGMSAVFINCNRNKRSVVLDLRIEADQRKLHQIVASCDVVVHSIRTQAARRMGISYEALSRLNHRLIYCHLKGFSDEGVYAGKPAYDDVIQALSGIASLQTSIVGEPRYVPTIFADKVSSLHAAYAVMLGLYHRSNTGLGQQITVPMFEAIAAFNAVEHLWGATFEPPISSMGYETIVKAARRPYATKDGHIAFLPYTDAHWQRFFEATGALELIEDERFCNYPARQKHFQAVWLHVTEQLALKTNAEWMSLFGNDMPIAVVNTLDDLLKDPHLESVGFWEFREHPSEGLLRFARSPFEMDDCPPSIRRLPPTLGQHTTEVFDEFGVETVASNQGGAAALAQP